jgi:hypothetical protein
MENKFRNHNEQTGQKQVPNSTDHCQGKRPFAIALLATSGVCGCGGLEFKSVCGVNNSSLGKSEYSFFCFTFAHVTPPLHPSQWLYDAVQKK